MSAVDAVNVQNNQSVRYLGYSEASGSAQPTVL
jgi:hypothetical protein